MGEQSLRMSSLSIILRWMMIQVCCFFVLFGHWVSKTEGWVGNSWEVQYPSVTASYINDVWAISPDNVFVVGFNVNGGIIGHYDGQSWQNTGTIILRDQLGELNGIWGTSQSDIFAVGGLLNDQYNEETLILHYDGVMWSIVDSQFPGSLFDIWGSGPDDVWAIGTEGLVIHWDGNSWMRIPVEITGNLYGIWGDGQNKIFVVGDDIILLGQDGILTSVQDLPPCYLSDVWGMPGGDVLAVGDCILRYRDGNWQDVTPNNLPYDFWLYRITGRSENDILAVGVTDYTGEEGLIIRYDGGEWNIEDCPFSDYFPGYLNGVWMGLEGDAVVVGGNFIYYDLYYDPITKGIILSFNGDSWSLESSECYDGTLTQIWANSSQDVYVVGGHPLPPTDELAKAFIAHYDGLYWSPIEVEEYGILYDIWGSSDNELFAVGADIYETWSGPVIESQILHSENGTDWESMSNNFDDVLQGVWGTSSDNVFAVGNGIYHFNGHIWSPMQSPQTVGLIGIWGSDAYNIFVVGEALESGAENGKATVLFYDGVQWTAMYHNIYGNLYKVWGTDKDNVFAVGENGIYHYDGQMWSLMTCPLDGCFYNVWGNSPTDVFATGEYGIVHYNGQVWENTGFIADPYSPIYGIGGTSSHDVFFAGDFGTILHYDGDMDFSQQRIFLQEGWNLISFQVNVCFHNQQTPPDVFLPEGVEFRQVEDLKAWLSDNSTSPIRDALNPESAGDWKRITSFDKGAVHLLDKDMAPYFNDLSYLGAGYGYWIKMNTPGYLLLQGNMLPPSTSLHLNEGWNLIGSISPNFCYYDTNYYGQDEFPPCIFSEAPPVTYISVSGQLVQTVLSSIEGKYSRVTGFDCAGINLYDIQYEWMCNLFYIAPGCGYWIKMTEEAELTLP